MPTKDRSYQDRSGRRLSLRSERTISTGNSPGWVLKLVISERRFLGRRIIGTRILHKSGEWSSTAIGFLQAQEELEYLREHGVEIELQDLLRR